MAPFVFFILLWANLGRCFQSVDVFSLDIIELNQRIPHDGGAGGLGRKPVSLHAGHSQQISLGAPLGLNICEAKKSLMTISWPKSMTPHANVAVRHEFLYLSALSVLQWERGRRSCSSNWCLLIRRWPSTRAWPCALGRAKKHKTQNTLALERGTCFHLYIGEGTVFVPNGRILSSESVSLSVLSSTRKSGQFHDMLTIPSDSCSRTWASIRPWQSITITWPSAVPNKTWGGVMYMYIEL